MALHKDFKKTQAYPKVCRGFLESLMQRQVSANLSKNRSIQVIISDKNRQPFPSLSAPVI